MVLNWTFLGVGVSPNQVIGFVLLWGAVFVLGYLNAGTRLRTRPPRWSAPGNRFVPRLRAHLVTPLSGKVALFGRESAAALTLWAEHAAGSRPSPAAIGVSWGKG